MSIYVTAGFWTSRPVYYLKRVLYMLRDVSVCGPLSLSSCRAFEAASLHQGGQDPSGSSHPWLPAGWSRHYGYMSLLHGPAQNRVNISPTMSEPLSYGPRSDTVCVQSFTKSSLKRVSQLWPTDCLQKVRYNSLAWTDSRHHSALSEPSKTPTHTHTFFYLPTTSSPTSFLIAYAKRTKDLVHIH